MPLVKAGFTLSEIDDMESDELIAWIQACKIDRESMMLDLLSILPNASTPLKNAGRQFNMERENRARKIEVALGTYKLQNIKVDKKQQREQMPKVRRK